MRNRRFAALLLSVILVFCTIFAHYFPYNLPKGKLHRIRERDIDIVHFKAELGFNFNTKSIRGKAAIVFRPLRQSNKISLDAIRLNVESVDLVQPSTTRSLKFSSKNQHLHITLDRSYSPDNTLTLSIQYNAQPNAGMYFIPDNDHKGQFFVYTYGEGGLLANCFPIYNDLNDKFSTEMLVTVPPPYSVISNGKLAGIEKLANGDQTFHWKQDLPHSNYLISIYVGEFEKGELPSAFGEIPLRYWVPKGKLQQGAYAFRNTTKMVEFFSKRFNYKYPWDKYDQIAVPDYSIGAMEHTSATGIRASVLRDETAPLNYSEPDFDRYFTLWTSEAVISHELSHHWFGDNLTCRSLDYIWLNESFATYCNMLWDEESQGKEALYFDHQEALDRYFNYVSNNHIIRPLEYHYYNAVNDMYATEITYFKGAIILHTLRNILGDEDFFRALSYYLHKHEFSNVVSTDFKIAIEEATGKNLDWFFEDWIYGGGYPIFEVSYQYLSERKLIDLTVKQIQPIIEAQDLFTLPVEITVATSKGMKREVVWVKHGVDQFLLGCDEKPLMVSFDGKGALVADIRFEKPLEELIYQVKHDELPGKIRALRQMAERFPVQQKTLQLIREILTGDLFWGLKAEAARLLAKIRTPESEKVILTALKADDYKIRKAAVLALSNFRQAFAGKTLKKVIKNDTHTDVVGTAIIALAKINPKANIDFIRQQLNRPAWYDEITLACLKAFAIIGDKRLVADIKPFTQPRYNVHLRTNALNAWKSCAPDDKNLHDLLLKYAEREKVEVQSLAIEMLGALKVAGAEPILEKVLANSGDLDFRIAAENTLNELKRIKKNN